MGCCFDTFQECFHRESFYLIIRRVIYYRKRNAEEQYRNWTQAFPKGKPNHPPSTKNRIHQGKECQKNAYSILYALTLPSQSREKGVRTELFTSKTSMIMNKKLMMIGLFLVAMLTGCSHDESPEAVDLGQTNVSAEFVSADEATTIAAAVQFGPAEATTAGGKATTRSAGLNKEVESVTPVPDASGATAFYVINYKGGGFMILSADKRVNPVLAFSETSTFPMNDVNGFPEGLVGWMTSTKAYIQSVRAKNTLLTEEMKGAWETSSIQVMLGPPPSDPWNPGDKPRPGNECINKHERVGPLLTTHWHQGADFNASSPLKPCANLGNRRAYVGCVAIAIGQVMKYHHYPASYNWNNMPDFQATTETARMLRDVGVAVGMYYECSGSFASLQGAVGGLQKLGYLVKSGGADYDVLIRELKAKRPIIFLAHDTNGQNGHAWVCDGWQYTVKYDHCIPYESEYIHLNWGYEQKYNAWYFPASWKMKGAEYNFRGSTILYEIKPR